MYRFVRHWAKLALEALLKSEEGPNDGKKAKGSSDCFACEDCKDPGTPSTTVYRCCDCFQPSIQCKRCILNEHIKMPFHFVCEWKRDERFWSRKALTSLGVVINLGHGGSPCPSHTRPPRAFTIVSQHGIHHLSVQFCECKGEKSVPESIQLVRAGLWPSTWDRPATAFTVPTLKDFDHLAHQCHVNAYDFYWYLRRKTDNIARKDVVVRAVTACTLGRGLTSSMQDRYDEFIMAVRLFNHVTMVKRHRADIDNLGYASLAVICPMCPRIDQNMDPAWRKRDKKLR